MSVLPRVSRYPRNSTARAAAWHGLAVALAACAAVRADPTGQAPAPPPPLPPPPATTATGSGTDAYREFRRLFEAKSYLEAVLPAQAALALAEERSGPSSEEAQVALMNLATTQYLAGDYVGAEANFLRVIELAEASGSPVTQRLARANAGLATTYYAGRRYDLAVPRFERAIALSRRSEGLLNVRQLPLLDKYADALTELGRLQDAVNAQRYALRIATRQYGDNDPRIAPALEKLGRWYARVGSYDASRATLQRGIDLIERAEGENAPALVGPLTALADCDRRQLQDPGQLQAPFPEADRADVFRDALAPPAFSPGAAGAEGEKALERAAAIATQRPNPLPAQIADVRTQLGDWFATRSQPQRALPEYRLAWAAARQMTTDGKPLTELLFGKPVLLHCVRPGGWNRYASRPREEIQFRNALASVTVGADGGVRDTKLLDDSGDPRRGEQTLQAASSARYRPRFENGEPAETVDVQFNQPWVVLLPKQEPPPAAAAETKH